MEHAAQWYACSARSGGYGAKTYTFRDALRVAIDIGVCSAHSEAREIINNAIISARLAEINPAIYAKDAENIWVFSAN